MANACCGISPMHVRILVLVGLAFVTHAAPFDFEDHGELFFVQSRAHFQARRAASSEDGVCMQIEDVELARPIRDVLAEHPGEDGWCIFGALGIWASKCAVARRSGSMVGFAAMGDAMYSRYLPVPKLMGPKRVQLPGGSQITIRDHIYPFDDLYCYAMGWYGLDRYQAVHNITYAEEVSKQSCGSLEKSYQNISMKEMMDRADSDAAELAWKVWSASPLPEVSQSLIDGMRLHAAAKCALSNGHGAICDVANCAERGCLLPEGTVGYTLRGECASVV
ncbi:unnamed protein product [Symbiodinium natans]|uniref:Uncharacterized protein n=1 Tax=Symbiodinium natans TaxID=878477 RepID=A0A812I2M2_9DINO|nr:unnamed protein product [Symbiodinium natans]